MFAVEIDQVSKRFGRLAAVANLSLQVPAGSIYGFIGPNGSGKTTTLRMIMRILHPDHGGIRVLASANAPQAALGPRFLTTATTSPCATRTEDSRCLNSEPPAKEPATVRQGIGGVHGRGWLPISHRGESGMQSQVKW